MNTANIIAYLEQPNLLANMNISDLEELVEAYPYFTIGHLLLTKKMQQTQHLLLKKAIKKSALITPNRKKVYEFLYQKEIQESIIGSQKESIVQAAEPSSVAEENMEESSSFNQAVEIPSSTKAESTFAQPINLKDLGKTNSDEIDLLEQQIIGQTIEHVLTQEIELNYDLASTPENESSQKPKSVSSKQKFSDWLEILDQSRIKSFGIKEESSSTEKDDFTESDIINSFLSKSTNIISSTKESVEFTPSNLARLSIVDDEDFVTETLANIYIKQGNLQKALNAFNKLMLKYPEKKTYFAARIEKIEKDLK